MVRVVGVLPRDTGSDPAKVEAPAMELAARTALVVGPDVQDLAIALRGVFGQRTLVMPSFATSFVHHKPTSWFVMGAGPRVVAEQMFALAQADGRQRPVVTVAPNGYDSQIGSDLNSAHAVPQVLPSAERVLERGDGAHHRRSRGRRLLLVGSATHGVLVDLQPGGPGRTGRR